MTTLVFGSVELTRSKGGICGIGLVVGGSRIDERGIRPSSSRVKDLLLDVSDRTEELSSSSR